MWRLNTLRVRFALWVACLLLAAIIAFGTFVYLRLAGALYAALDDSLRLRAGQVIAGVNIENGRLTSGEAVGGDPAGTGGGVADLTRLLDPQGHVLEAAGRDRTSAVDGSTLARVRQGQSLFTTIVAPGVRLRVYSAPVIDASHVAGIVQVGQSVVPVEYTLHRLLAALLVGGPLLVGGAAVGGYLLARQALAPIDTITRTARSIGAEALHTRINVPATDDEVGRLAATFNAMLERIDHAFQRERQFTADASHELRTPLAAMQVILGVTRAGPRRPEEYVRALDDLAVEADRLRTLADDLLRLGRTEALDRTAYEQVDLSMLLGDIVDVMKPRATLQGLQLASVVPDGMVIWGNRDWLVSLFTNLVDNALKYTDHGSVTVRGAIHDKVTEVAVIDTGIGIAAEQLPHIYDRFYRVDVSRSTRGAGLGLAITKAIVAAHAGRMDVESRPGVGTTFIVRLPLGSGEVLLSPVQPRVRRWR